MDTAQLLVKNLPRILYAVLEQIDPYGTVYINFNEPLEVWNYIIYTTPPVLFVVTCMFVSFPITLYCMHWIPKLLWPRLVGLEGLHEFLRRLEYITDPRPHTLGDLIKYMEQTLNNLMDQRDER